MKSSHLFHHFSIHGGSSVRTYLDCHWITTQVLHIPSLVVPKDTDLIIGYMYQVSTTSTSLYGYCQTCLHTNERLSFMFKHLSSREKKTNLPSSFPPFISLFIVTLNFLLSTQNLIEKTFSCLKLESCFVVEQSAMVFLKLYLLKSKSRRVK